MTRLLALCLCAAAAGCVARPAAPPPTPAPQAPVTPPPPRPAPPVLQWIDRPLTPGDWSYARGSAGSVASFSPGSAVPLLALSCEVGSRTIIVARAGADVNAAALVLTATTGARSYPAYRDGGGQDRVVSRIPAADPHLDALAFSRGRFMVSLDGRHELILPSWPEISRVIEDCRP